MNMAPNSRGNPKAATYDASNSARPSYIPVTGNDKNQSDTAYRTSEAESRNRYASEPYERSASVEEPKSARHYTNEGGKRKLAAAVEAADYPETIIEDGEQQMGLKLLFAASLLQSKEQHITMSSMPFHCSSPDGSFRSQRSDAVASTSPNRAPPGQTLPHDSASFLNIDVNSAADSDHETSTTAASAPPHTPAVVARSNPGTDLVRPTDLDVLCGRGGLINKHAGNIVYRRVVDHNKTIYKQVPKRHRILVSQSIVQTIQNHGGRFLQSQQSGKVNSAPEVESWTCIPFKKAVQKTSQALREPSQPEHDADSNDEDEGDEKSHAKKQVP